MKKCTGESGDIGDIAKNVNIAMQKIAWDSWDNSYPSERLFLSHKGTIIWDS